jgi:hypothetical protein
LGVDAHVGLLQRPERVVLLSAPQAFFGLALGGLVLIAIIVLLTVIAWITAAQRIAAVHAAVRRDESGPPTVRALSEAGSALRRSAPAKRVIAKGE